MTTFDDHLAGGEAVPSYTLILHDHLDRAERKAGADAPTGNGSSFIWRNAYPPVLPPTEQVRIDCAHAGPKTDAIAALLLGALQLSLGAGKPA